MSREIPPYRLIRSSRRTVQLSLDEEGQALVRAPRRLPRAEIDRFVAAHAGWLADKRAAWQARQEKKRVLSETEIAALRQQAAAELPARVAFWGTKMGLHPASVRITGAQKRWGSCSSRRTICFSYRVMMLPEEAREYVVVHELAHLRHMDHSPAFYLEIARCLPDYRDRIRLLRDFEKSCPIA